MSAAVAPDTVTIDRLVKTFPGATRAAVQAVSLELPAGSVTALLGPSGCGKTTTLNIIAGLLAPEAGDVRFGGRSVLGLPPERRPVAMVFQKALLFPHLNVAENVGFGLRMRGVARRDRERRVADLLALVRLEGYGGRRVHELSGGQEQRVALARGLVTEPRVLLLDEPFSQLDAALRAEMRTLVRDVQAELSVTTLFVTHDQVEAVEIADTLALMIEGRIEQHDVPRAFFERPATVATAAFFDAGNLIPGVICGQRFCSALGTLAVPGCHREGPATLVVRKESLRLGEGPGDNTVHGTVTGAQYRGTHIAVTVDVAGVRLSVTAPPSVSVTVGARVSVHLPPHACTIIARS